MEDTQQGYTDKEGSVETETQFDHLKKEQRNEASIISLVFSPFLRDTNGRTRVVIS
jgi:hypothetical protein